MKLKLEKLIYDYPTESKRGFNNAEIVKLLNEHYPQFTMGQFHDKMGVVTVLLENGITIYFHSDVELTIRCLLQNRTPTIFEWD